MGQTAYLDPGSVFGNPLPKVWKTPLRRSRFGDAAILAFLLAQLFDGIFTYIGVNTFGLGVEANPLIAGLMASFGHGAALLGAKSLDDALSAMETVKAAAATDRRIVAEARESRARYQALQQRLSARAQKLRAVEAGVAATASSLASAKAERISYLRQLTAQRSLNNTQISSLESHAQAIEAQAKQVAVAQTVSVGQTTPVASAPVAGVTSTLTVLATAYTLHGTTATGAPVGYGVVAVDPKVIPLGTRMTIPGYGEGIAADTGGAIQGAVIDLWFPNAGQAAAWGRRTVTITLH